MRKGFGSVSAVNDTPRLAVKPAPGNHLEAELAALYTIYRCAIQRYEEVKAVAHTPDNSPDDGSKFKEDSAAAVRKKAASRK